jgi:hypothetical protein
MIRMITEEVTRRMRGREWTKRRTIEEEKRGMRKNQEIETMIKEIKRRSSIDTLIKLFPKTISEARTRGTP